MQALVSFHGNKTPERMGSQVLQRIVSCTCFHVRVHVFSQPRVAHMGSQVFTAMGRMQEFTSLHNNLPYNMSSRLYKNGTYTIHNSSQQRTVYVYKSSQVFTTTDRRTRVNTNGLRTEGFYTSSKPPQGKKTWHTLHIPPSQFHSTSRHRSRHTTSAHTDRTNRQVAPHCMSATRRTALYYTYRASSCTAPRPPQLPPSFPRIVFKTHTDAY